MIGLPGAVQDGAPQIDAGRADPRRGEDTLAKTDATFSGTIAQFYDRYFGPPLFGPYGEDVARRLKGLSSGALLEVATGTGIVTAVLARALPAGVTIIATDLNQPMLDFAATKPGLDRVTWQQADAMALPFPDASFDVVVCQFGVMFFPDRPGAHAEARRVLRPGGRYIFNVWDKLAHNPVFEVVHRAVADLYPARPPGFIARTPCGYNDEVVIREDLRRGGFEGCTIEMVETTWSPSSPQDPAIACCQGSPLAAEIEVADPDGPNRATETAAAAIAAHLGGRSPDFPTRALLIEAAKQT
jgi:SAM-dependent methyltransferase